MARSLSSVSLTVFVDYAVLASQPLPIARRLIARPGDIWQEWAGVRPERVFAQPWSSEVLLGAVLDAMVRCDVCITVATSIVDIAVPHS